MRRTLLIIALLAFTVPSAHAAEAPQAELSEPVVVVDVDTNMLSIIYPTGNHTDIPVITGMKKTIRYNGNTYFAATPLARWEVKSISYFPGQAWFGETGLFLRLYRDGDTRTPYGIHNIKNFDKNVVKPASERYGSYGCVLVDQATLEDLYHIYEMNGGRLTVYTTFGQQKLQDEIAKRNQFAAMN